MRQLLQISEVKSLKGYLSDPKNPHENLHARITRTKNTQRSLLGLFGIKEVEGEVQGGFCGPEGEFDFIILNNGNVDVTYSSYTDDEEESNVLMRIATGIRRRLREGFPDENFPANRTFGEYYLQRSGSAEVTAAARAAIAASQLTERFVKKMKAISLRVIRGKKRPIAVTTPIIRLKKPK